MTRTELLSVLADAVVARKSQQRPLKVAIDGRCASGKTTLADALGSRLALQQFQVLRPSVDGFHHPRERRYRQGELSAQGYYDDAYDYDAIIEMLLRPLSGDSFPTLCHQVSLNLRTNLPNPGTPISVGENAILLFEGIFVLRHRLKPFWDLGILVDTAPEVALARAVRRDAEVFGSLEAARKRYEVRYEPAWQIYLREEDPIGRADFVIDNSDVERPLVVKSGGPV